MSAKPFVLRKFISFITVLMLFQQVNSQQIIGSIKDETGKPLANVTVSLKAITDSSLIKINATNAAGNFEFKTTIVRQKFNNYAETLTC